MSSTIEPGTRWVQAAGHLAQVLNRSGVLQRPEEVASAAAATGRCLLEVTGQACCQAPPSGLEPEAFERLASMLKAPASDRAGLCGLLSELAGDTRRAAGVTADSAAPVLQDLARGFSRAANELGCGLVP